MKNMTRLASAFLATASLYAAAETLEERIKPAGSLCMAGDDCAAAPLQLASASGARSGKDVYDSKCAACHATGAAGAPKLGDAATWTARIGKGTDTLYASVINGLNGMPAKGLCFDCSDEELKASVDYIVEKSK